MKRKNQNTNIQDNTSKRAKEITLTETLCDDVLIEIANYLDVKGLFCFLLSTKALHMLMISPEYGGREVFYRVRFDTRFPNVNRVSQGHYEQAFKEREALYQTAIQKRIVLDEMTDKRLAEDKAFVLPKVSQNGYALLYASDTLKDDETIVRAAIEQRPWAYVQASERVKAIRAFALLAVSQEGIILSMLPEILKADRALVLHAVHATAHALQYASVDLQQDIFMRAAAYVPGVSHALLLGHQVRQGLSFFNQCGRAVERALCTHVNLNQAMP